MAGLKLSYVHGASEKPLIGETIGQFFDAACAKWAARPALVVRHQKVRLSYGELKEAVDRLAAGLARLSIISIGVTPNGAAGSACSIIDRFHLCTMYHRFIEPEARYTMK